MQVGKEKINLQVGLLGIKVTIILRHVAIVRYEEYQHVRSRKNKKWEPRHGRQDK